MDNNPQSPDPTPSASPSSETSTTRRVVRKRRSSASSQKNAPPSFQRWLKKRRRLLRNAIVGFLLSLLLFVALLFAWQYWNQFQHQRLTQNLNQKILTETQAQNWNEVISLCQQSLELNPQSEAALKSIILALENIRPEEALAYHKRYSHLHQDTAAAFQWAQSARKFGSVSDLRYALASIPAAHQDEKLFHELKGWAGARQEIWVEAEYHFQRALELEPSNRTYQYGLAEARYHLPELEKSRREETAALIKTLLEEPGILKKETLLLRAKGGHPFPLTKDEALSILQQLSELPPDPESTRIQLELAQTFSPTRFAQWIPGFLDEIPENKDQIASSIQWLNQHQMAAQALAVRKKITDEWLQDTAILAAFAETFIHLEQWEDLEEWLDRDGWENAPHLKLAYLAHANCEGDFLRGVHPWQQIWEQAVATAKPQNVPLEQLANLALRWGIPIEAEKIFWYLEANTNTATQWLALNRLMEINQQFRNTLGLLRVSHRLEEARNPFVIPRRSPGILALLVDLDQQSSRQKVEEEFRKAPENIWNGVALALSLHQQGKSKDALSILMQYPTKLLERDTIPVYLTSVLAALGRYEKASEWREQVPLSLLLPEEETLLLRADESLNQYLQVKQDYLSSPQDAETVAAYAFALFLQEEFDHSKRLIQSSSNPSTPPQGAMALIATLLDLEEGNWNRVRSLLVPAYPQSEDLRTLVNASVEKAPDLLSLQVIQSWLNAFPPLSVETYLKTTQNLFLAFPKAEVPRTFYAWALYLNDQPQEAANLALSNSSSEAAHPDLIIPFLALILSKGTDPTLALPYLESCNNIPLLSMEKDLLQALKPTP